MCVNMYACVWGCVRVYYIRICKCVIGCTCLFIGECVFQLQHPDSHMLSELGNRGFGFVPIMNPIPGDLKTDPRDDPEI